MPDFMVSALLAPSRLTLKLLRVLTWTLVYWAACLTATVYGLVALGHVLRHPQRGCCGRPHRTPPACLSDSSCGEHRYLSLKSSGLRLHYVSAGEGNGPLMLFLHGFPENWFSWRHQLREFQSHFHVVALDLRGYGSSDAPSNLDCYTLEALTIDIKDTVEALGYSKCILVAHDWGGILAWNFSIYYPALLDRLVVVSAAPMSVYQDYALHHWSQLFHSSYMFLFQLPWLPEKLLSISDFQILKTTVAHPKTGIPNLTPEEMEAFIYGFSQRRALIGPLNYYRNLFRQFPLEPQELLTPTLLLWGDKDPYLEAGLVSSISSRFIPGRLQAHVLPGEGHWIPQSCPELMNQYMWAFLQEPKD
ncbi:epoxide hydrolase 3 [Ornithorhynchus anatinus]|uniref:Epoxide hydrolase 3 n=1 Tax=Ornithorhynchus anatinus TaxID=9258 RepID=A0A6I8PGS1_ORNAN|nr:epoxide hydrolase 3 [Ornithorhynchus anatinus]XP_028905612.1 epoxide hydrolase 3 [Ornithorhynchus anatinus]